MRGINLYSRSISGNSLGHKAGFRGAEQGSEWRREMLMEGFLEELIAEPHLPQGGNVSQVEKKEGGDGAWGRRKGMAKPLGCGSGKMHRGGGSRRTHERSRVSLQA